MKKKDVLFIERMLLPDLPGFALDGQLMFTHPIHSVLRALFFDRSIDPQGFYVQVFFQPLFIPVESIYFNIGWRLGGNSHLWRMDTLHLVEELHGIITRDALPFLLTPESPREIAEAILSLDKSEDLYVQQAIAYCFARTGDLDRATNELDKYLKLLDVEKPFEWQLKLAERAENFKQLLRTDPIEAQRQLNAWEIESIRNLGLEKFRKSTF